MKKPLSMTSFGRGEATDNGRTWTAEIRSVNHRYCDISIKMSRKYAALEERIKKELTGCFSRGHIDVYINAQSDLEEDIVLQANIPLVRQYYNCLIDIKQALSIDEAPSLNVLASYKDVITSADEEEDIDALWPGMRKALAEALNNAQKMRAAEGSAIKKDLLSRLKTVSGHIKKIEKNKPEILAEKKKLLEERLERLLDNVDLDPMRLAQEVAVMTDKTDISEELVRIHSHISQFQEFFKDGDPIGRRLDFLLQEFFREINTISSKISNASMAHITVELKNEVEKMREQVQNLE